MSARRYSGNSEGEDGGRGRPPLPSGRRLVGGVKPVQLLSKLAGRSDFSTQLYTSLQGRVLPPSSLGHQRPPWTERGRGHASRPPRQAQRPGVRPRAQVTARHRATARPISCLGPSRSLWLDWDSPSPHSARTIGRPPASAPARDHDEYGKDGGRVNSRRPRAGFRLLFRSFQALLRRPRPSHPSWMDSWGWVGMVAWWWEPSVTVICCWLALAGWVG
jgi:hypothetical protein